MSWLEFALVITAAFVHACWNLAAKQAAEAGATFVFACGLLNCVFYAPWAFWLFLHGDVSLGWPVVGVIVLSGVLHLGYSLCLQRGYQVADLSVVYPTARGTGPLLSSIGAFLLLREAPSSLRIAGLLAIVAGIGLISTQGRWAAFCRPGGLAGLRWGIATGGLIAAYTVLDAYGVKTLGIQPVILDWCSFWPRLLMLAPLVLRNPEQARTTMAGRWRFAVAVGALAPLSYILVLSALRMGTPLSVVAPTRETSMMISALLGMIVLRESVGRWRFIGCLMLVIGVILLDMH